MQKETELFFANLIREDRPITDFLNANYTFLNYLVLVLGFLLLDDRFLVRFVPARFRPNEPEATPESRFEPADDAPISIFAASRADAHCRTP